MKVITWNCNMAYRKKAAVILKHKPDILIVQECEHPEKLIYTDDIPVPNDVFWYGSNQNKGIAVFSYCDMRIQLLDVHESKFRYVIPLTIFNDKIHFTLFAVWCQKLEKHDCYTEQIWNAIHFYDQLLKFDNVIIVGDFNSNSIWDKPRRIYNHTNLVKELRLNRIYSAYHHFYKQEQGQEKHPTLFMHRKINRPYHIDYCFASQNLIEKLTEVEIGEYNDWTMHSDHKPLIVKFDIFE